MTGRHEAPPVGSAAREATAPPWHGTHRATAGMSSRDVVRSFLLANPGRTAFEIARAAFGKSGPTGGSVQAGSVRMLCLRMVRDGELTSETAHDPSQGKSVTRFRVNDFVDIPRHRALERFCVMCLLPLEPEHVKPRKYDNLHDGCVVTRPPIDWAEPAPDRCPSCGHPYQPGQQHCCGIQRHYDDKTGGPDDA